MTQSTNKLIKEWRENGMDLDSACVLIDLLILERESKTLTWRDFLVTGAKGIVICFVAGWVMAAGSDVAYRMFGTKEITSHSTIEVIYKLDAQGEMVELSRELVEDEWPEDKSDDTTYR